MTEHDTQSKRPRAIRITLGIVVLCGALIAGRWVMTSSVQAQAPDAGAQMGEALMQLAGSGAAAPDQASGPGWYTCEVMRTGAGWGNVYLSLKSSSFSERWFRAKPAEKNGMLATALTAISGNKKVQVYVTATTTSPYGDILACYVLK